MHLHNLHGKINFKKVLADKKYKTKQISWKSNKMEKNLNFNWQ